MTNSTAALKQKDRALMQRERVIYSFLLNRLLAHSALGQPTELTDRQIMTGMGFVDMNEVRPRITSLIDLEWLVKTGDMICPVTKCKVRLVKALTDKERAARMEPQMGLFQ